MKCIICEKSMDKGQNQRLVIGMACEKCLPRTDLAYKIRMAAEPEDSLFSESLLNALFDETEFIEFGKWYNIQEMEKLLGITEKGEYVGFAAYKIEPEDRTLMTLLTINVIEPFFRKGIATALLKEVKRIATQAGVSKIRVPISNDDLVSYVFYHKNGFRLTGIDIALCVKRHGSETEGFWGLPCRDEFYLELVLKN